MPDLEELLRVVESSPWYRLIGLKPRWKEDSIVVELEVDENRHYQALGTAHGGVVASVLDSCIGLRINFELFKQGKKAVTAQLNVHYLKPVRKGKIKGVGEIVKMGSKTAVGRGEVVDETGEVVATGTATFIIVDGK